jgi:hypothetical protein
MKNSLFVTISIFAFAISLYLSGFFIFSRSHYGIGSLKTKKMYYSVPDTGVNRILTFIYAPLLHYTRKEVTLYGKDGRRRLTIP